MSTRISIDAKAYYQTTGTRATWNASVVGGVHVGAAAPNLTEITRVKDISYTPSKEKADVSRRGNGGWKAYRGTLKDLELTISMPLDPTDTAYKALLGSYLSNTTIALAILSGVKTLAGEEGVWGDFEVFSVEKSEQLAEGQMVTFTVGLGDSAVAPEWVRVA
jgi:hypothetical protein